ncbi:glycine betaine ABC transporter substrate-binding protein [Pseudomonas sp. JDS28PS106]|uniref:glycine betaine ABC transporter substrate-binding protein n=1 Tax=Pseudomonas sp. JDS28PS106 TaxID=2497235 RepID=UPI002FD11972
MKALVKLCAALVLTMMYALSAHAESGIVKVGSLAWEDQMAISQPTVKFLEKQGFKVEFTKFSEWGIAFGALQHGDIDILLSSIDYVTSDYWAKYKNRLEKISVASYGVRQGLVVPTYMNIDSVDQLNTVSDQVSAKIIGIEPGSGLMREAADALKKYDLKYQIIDGSTAAMVAQLQSSLERKQPIVVTLWEPSWMMQKFDVKFLADPKGAFAPSQGYYWIGQKGWSEKNPRARESVATVYIPKDDITAIAGDMNNGKTINQAVDAWWDKNQKLVDKWSVMSPR